ncbi:hypothetical protein D3C78_1147260 [compost metagenome]
MSIPVNTGNTEDFTRANLEANAVQHVFALLALHMQGINRQHDVPRIPPCFLHLKGYIPAHHKLCKLLLVGLLRSQGADYLPPSDYGNRIGQRHNLLELMRNNNNRLALRSKAANDLHQLFYFLNG